MIIAAGVRWSGALLHRTINRLVAHHRARRAVPPLLRPLRERMPTAAVDPAAFVPERRRQRAEAIGSVLRSFASVGDLQRSRADGARRVRRRTWPRCWPAPASPAWRSASARRTWSRTSSPACSCCWRTSTASATWSTSARRAASVEAVGLRITTIRDGRGVLWYIRNGEIVRVGNKSQGWARGHRRRAGRLRRRRGGDRGAARGRRRRWPTTRSSPPTSSSRRRCSASSRSPSTARWSGRPPRRPRTAQWRVGRELRRRLTEALERAGIAAQIAAARMFVRAGRRPHRRDRPTDATASAEPPDGRPARSADRGRAAVDRVARHRPYALASDRPDDRAESLQRHLQSAASTFARCDPWTLIGRVRRLPADPVADASDRWRRRCPTERRRAGPSARRRSGTSSPAASSGAVFARQRAVAGRRLPRPGRGHRAGLPADRLGRRCPPPRSRSATCRGCSAGPCWRRSPSGTRTAGHDHLRPGPDGADGARRACPACRSPAMLGAAAS